VINLHGSVVNALSGLNTIVNGDVNFSTVTIEVERRANDQYRVNGGSSRLISANRSMMK
jgi:hypothetical protein